MRRKLFMRWIHLILIGILVLGLGTLVNSQDKQGDKYRQLREEILSIYQSGGEQGLLDIVKKQKEKITTQFIADFAKSGVKNRKEEWLKVCEILAEKKKDEKILADVLYQTGKYFGNISNKKKAFDYLDKAFPIYLKLKDQVGQGNICHSKGMMFYYMGKNSQALEMLDKALPFFEKAGELIGLGNVYLSKGVIYIMVGEKSRAIEILDKALLFFEKARYPQGQGNIYLNKGDIFRVTGENSRALEMYDKALTFFEKTGESLSRGSVYESKGEIYFRNGENSKALEMYDKAMPLIKKAGDPIGQGYLYLRMGKIYFSTGDNSKALEMYDKALPLFEKAGIPVGLGNAYSSKGGIYERIGEISKALEMYNEALPFFEKAGSCYDQGNVYWNKGDIYIKIGEISKALEMYDKAMPFFKKIKSPHGLGNVYASKASIYYNTGDKSRALEMYDKALFFFEKAGQPHGQGIVYICKGEVYNNIGDESKALEMYDKAMPFFEKMGYPIGQGNVCLGKGDFYKKIGKYLKALEMYDKAMPFFEKAGIPAGKGSVYYNKGEIYSRTGENLKALEMYNKAISFYKKAGDMKKEYNALHGKIEIFVKQGKKEKALELFEKGIITLEKVRTKTAFSEMKRTFMEGVYKHYEETVLFMLENKYYEKGLKYAEAMRARVFMDQMAEGLVKLDKGLPLKLKQKRNILVATLSVLSKKIHKTAEKKDEKKMQRLKEQYSKTENEFKDLLIKIRLENPLYASVRYPQPVSIQALQREVLKRGELLLRYFISPEKLYAFLVAKKKFKVVTLEVSEEEINSIAERYLLAIKENNANDMRRFGRALYEKLFKPLEKKLKKSRNIIIIPDGHLATIPFGSLIIDEKETGQPVFLLEKYRVKYIQSASILSVLRKHYRRNRETKNFIGFGDPVYDYDNFRLSSVPSVSSVAKAPPPAFGDEIKEIYRSRYARAGGILPRLQGSGEEVKAIARLFEKQSQKSAVYIRDKATEENAKVAVMKDFDYIHFACHGILNDDFQSLVLSQDIPDKKDDGYFTLNEIMNCDYNAKLVVLSACQTGTGKMERAEGVTGLTRAVMYAGTPAVLASLWKVDDKATKELMVDFYTNMLEKNMDKTEALRQAKLELLKNRKYSSPLFWGAFVLYGE